MKIHSAIDHSFQANEQQQVSLSKKKNQNQLILFGVAEPAQKKKMKNLVNSNFGKLPFRLIVFSSS